MCLTEFFEEKCKEVYRNSCNSSYPCPDMFCAVVVKNEQESESSFNPMLSNFQNFCKVPGKTIGMILESPHTYEYDFNGLPIAPARGKTGLHLKDFFLKHLFSNGFPNEIYKLLLIEAVSFQCSNGLDIKESGTSRERNKLFKLVWRNGGEEDLKKRLKQYKPEIIINACTGGVRQIYSGSYLNGIVQKALNELKSDNEDFRNVLFFCSNHPSDKSYKDKMMTPYIDPT